MLPTLSSAEREQTRRAREALLGGGLLSALPGSSGVPHHIEKSWRRCVGDGVPTALELTPRERDDTVSTLHRAAAPVLDRLKDSFADVPVAMVLADASGRILMRHADVRRQRLVMDRAGAAEGFDYSEGSIGTNGIAISLLERRPVLVRGPEHYNALLENLTCASTPLVEPGSGRLVGSFSLACAMRDVHPLMMVMTGDIGRQIEARIVVAAGERHQRIVQAYLALERAGTAALVVDESTVLANRLGLAHAGPELHPVLWRFLTEHGPDRAARMPVPLSGGFHEALVEPFRDGDTVAYSVQLLARRPARPKNRPPSVASVAGVPTEVREPLHFDAGVIRQLETALGHAELVVLTGGSGTGKLRTALQVLRQAGISDPLVVEPHLDPGWFTSARTAVAEGRGLVLRRLHAVPSPTVPQVQALIASGSPVVITVDLEGADDVVLGLVRQVATTVRLPALAQCREHLPALVQAMLAELPEPDSATRFTPAVWDLLMSWHWPGNLAELRNTVALLARRAGGGVVDTDGLPDELRTHRRTVGLMESAERAAVAEALAAAAGNRSRAARALGVGRNTLYRKMREFGLT
ncbi:MAG: Fis family sigma-54 specific transcriptional regulator [Modestobacter sp.]|nr:Fis family sigma-54 specific transcriptional regulator [Modestobacter sp.]